MDKFSELKDALEFLETTEFDGEWDSALVGGENGKNYHAVINANDVVVRAADDSRHTSWLCDYLEAASPVNIRALLAELEREQGIRAQNLEIKTLLGEKVKTLETKLWDSQQLVDAKSGSQIELRSQISSLEERNRKDMAWRGERLCELEDLLEEAQKRIAELETKLSEMTTFRDNALNKALRHWEELLELRAKLATPVRLPDVLFIKVSGSAVPVMHAERVKERIRAAGFTVGGE